MPADIALEGSNAADFVAGIPQKQIQVVDRRFESWMDGNLQLTVQLR